MKITVFYNKTTGAIKNIYVAEAEANFNFFADKQNEYEKILDKIIVDFNLEFARNWYNYKVDLDTKSIIKI